jgi:hypothetical protein
VIIINGVVYQGNANVTTRNKIEIKLNGETVVSGYDGPVEVVVDGDLVDVVSDMNVKRN